MIRPSRRLRASIFLAVVLGSASVLVAACGSHATAHAGAPGSAGAPSVQHPTTSPAAATTLTRTFSPYDASGAVTAPLDGHESGSCFTSSIAVASALTFRCSSANELLDPCYAPAGVRDPATLVCVTDPWTPGTLLMLTAPLPTPDPSTRTTPWALELANGARCVALTGTVDQVGSIALSYGCGGPAAAGLSAQGVGGAALSVEYRATATAPLTAVTVRTAWH